jgi:hypothetical protein
MQALNSTAIPPGGGNIVIADYLKQPPSKWNTQIDR